MNALDTNILIYACDPGYPSHQRIALGLIRANQGGALLWQVACEFVSATRKLAGQGFTKQDAWKQLAEYMVYFDLKMPTRPVLQRACGLHRDKQIALWDALIIGACQELGVERLYSEDLPGHVVDSPQIINPFI